VTGVPLVSSWANLLPTNFKRSTLLYFRTLPDSATVYGAFLDGSGRIEAIDSLTTSAVVRPGATVAFDLSGNFGTTAQLDSVRSMKVSVDPCGDGFIASSCPIAGARWTG
jgi:hypothetical protein